MSARQGQGLAQLKQKLLNVLSSVHPHCHCMPHEMFLIRNGCWADLYTRLHIPQTHQEAESRLLTLHLGRP